MPGGGAQESAGVTPVGQDGGKKLSGMLPGRDRAPRIGYFRHEGLTQDTGGAFLDVDKQNAFAGTGVAVVLQPSDAICRSLAARRRADAASALYRANIDATLLRAADAYFVLAESHAREAIARDDMRAAQELLRVEQARQEAGAGLPAAVARARARVAEAEGRLEAARGEVQADTAELVCATPRRGRTGARRRNRSA